MRNQDSWDLQVLLTKSFIRSRLSPVEFMNKLAGVEGLDLIEAAKEKECRGRKYVSAYFLYEETEQVLNIYWWSDRPTEIFTKF